MPDLASEPLALPSHTPHHPHPPPAQLLEEKRTMVEAMALALLDKEVLGTGELKGGLGCGGACERCAGIVC